MSAPMNTPAPKDHVEPYSLPLMEGRVVTRHGEVTTGNLPTADDIATLIEQSKEEGYAAGYQEGLSQGQQAAEAHIETLALIARQMQTPLDVLDDEIIQAIAALARGIAKSIVRTHLIAQPEEIVAVVREAVAHLPVSDRKITIKLNPEDLILVENSLNDQPIAQQWSLQADATVTPGGCVVNTNISTVDETLESRIEKVVFAMQCDGATDVE